MTEDSHDHDHDHDHEHEHEHEHDHEHEHEHEHGLRARVTSLFVGHRHDHVDTIDSALTSSADGMRALKISVLMLALTAVAEFVIVVFSGSVAVLGDTIHNAGDVLTALPLGFAFWLQRRPPTERYTYGYGRAEDLAGVFVCVIIGVSATVTAWISIARLIHPSRVSHLGLIAAAGVVGFLGNEIVATYRVRVGQRIGSAALVADGMHARADGVTSLAVVLGAAGVAAGWSSADAVVGLVISVIIFNVLRQATRDIVRRLMDSVDPALVDQIDRVLREVPGVEGVTSIRVRWIGHRLEAEATIVSAATLTLNDAHVIAENAHHQLLHDVPRLSYALIHSDPTTDDGSSPHDVTGHHFS